MKKILTILILGIFFISFASAVDFDNVRIYDKENEKITITNSFGFGEEIAQLQLITPHTYRLIDKGEGVMQKVAEVKILNYSDKHYKKLYGLDFYNVKKGNKKFDRHYEYKYRIKTGVSNEIYYDYEKCGDIQFCNHEVDKFSVWNKFDSLKELPEGEIYIGIFTDIEYGEVIEWIPNWFGEYLDEWALWDVSNLVYTGNKYNVASLYNGADNITEGLTFKPDGTKMYIIGHQAANKLIYEFNLSSAWNVTTAVQSTSYSVAPSINNPTSLFFKPDGYQIFIQGEGGNDFLQLSLTRPWEIATASVNGTVDPGISQPKAIFLKSDGSKSYSSDVTSDTIRQYDLTSVWDIDTLNAGSIQTYDYSGEGTQAEGLFFKDDGTNFWTVDKNNYHIHQYNLGTAWDITSTSYSGINYSLGDQATKPTSVHFRPNGDYLYILDDRLKEIYEYQTSVLIFNQNLPEDGFNSTDNNITFVYNITSSSNIINLSLFIDDVLNYTLYNSTTTDNLNISIEVQKISEDSHNWSISGCTETVCEESNYKYFNIDTTPIIFLVSPTPNNNTNSSGSSFIINVSLTEKYFDNLTFNIFNSSFDNINSTTYSDNTRNINFTVPYSDTFYYNVSMTTNTNKKNYTKTRYLNVDITNPLNNLFSPSGVIDYHLLGNNLTFNWTASDTHLDSCILNYNNINISVNCLAGNYSFIPVNNVNNASLIINDTFGNEITNTTYWDYKIFQNNETHSATIFETETETYSINITANSSLTGIKLNWNSTNYTMTNSGGGLWTYTRDIPIGVNTFNISYLFNYAGSTIESTNYTQYVNFTYFTLNNATYTDTFLNISFKDENDLTIINASVPTSSFTYYLGTGSINKTYTFSNTSNNFNYAFAGTTGSKSLKFTDISFQYRQVSDYPQRIWQPSLQNYNSTDTDQTLYLLNTNDGIFVTYQVLTVAESPISGVDVKSTRLVSGETIQVGSGTTDSAGTVTFWMNPDFQHTTIFNKTGYDPYTFVHFPTQASYTITLGGTTEDETDCTRGITQIVRPSSDFLYRGNIYDFNYTITTSYWNLTEFGYSLTSNTDINLGSGSSTTATGGILSSNNVNISNYSAINMNYYFTVDDSDCSQITYTKTWLTQTTTGTEYGIWQLATDFNTYVSGGLFGFDNFGKTLVSFVILVLMVGGLSRRYGIASEGAIMGILFGTVFILDVGLGLLPKVEFGDIVSIDYFFTFITFIILLGILIREERR